MLARKEILVVSGTRISVQLSSKGDLKNSVHMCDEKCGLLHPFNKICSTSLKKGTCSKTDCKYIHTKGTRTINFNMMTIWAYYPKQIFTFLPNLITRALFTICVFTSDPLSLILLDVHVLYFLYLIRLWFSR